MIHFVPWKLETQQQLNDCCGGGSQIGMTSCVCLLYTCSTTVQTSASDDLLNHGISALGECMQGIVYWIMVCA